MTITTADLGRLDRPPVTDAERTAWIVVVAGTALLGIAGFVNSFERVNQRMVPYFGHLAWTVPLAVDIGILLFTALDLLMAYRDIRSVWLRYVPRALVAVTVYLNVVGETTMEGRVAHAVLPIVWVIAVETAGVAVRAVFGMKTERARLDRIRRSRWLLAPVSTARMRRAMILSEETSLPAARQRWTAYRLAKADLRDHYGHFAWMWKAPRRTRLVLRSWETDPDPVTDLVPTPAETGPETTRDHRSARRRATNARPARTNRRPVLTDADLTRVAETIAEQMAADGVALTRRPFVDRMRAAGHPIGTNKAKALLDQIRHRGTNGDQPPDQTDS